MYEENTAGNRHMLSFINMFPHLSPVEFYTLCHRLGSN